MSLIRRSLVPLAIIFVALPACHSDSTGPSPALMDGSYVLESVSGRGPVVGSVTLSAAGEAERRVRYRQSGGELSKEYVARGSFQPRADGTIDLQLREDDGRSSSAWRPLARFSSGVLSIRYPDPADGPDIVETYQRQ